MQRFAAQKKSSLTAREKNCTLLLQRRAVLVCKQQTSEGVYLPISTTTLAYPLQKKLLQGNLFSNLCGIIISSIFESCNKWL